MATNANISIPFIETARRMDGATAIAHQTPRRYETITFTALEAESAKLASSLAGMGVSKGTRVIMMVRPGINFVALTFALFRAGAVPVFIDPGMGAANFLNCADQARPEGFAGVTRAHLIRLLYRKHFRAIKHVVTIGRKFFWGGVTYNGLLAAGNTDHAPAETKPDDTAAIIFTTGSTGAPKGVTYTHSMFAAQRETIRESYGIREGDCDLAAFPLFALFSVSLGMKAVIPDMDASAPASVDPVKIVEAVNDQKANFTFGSPAIWDKVSRYATENGIKLPTLKKVLMAGAPVRKEIHERLLSDVLTDGAETHTPYGATESLPIADMRGSEVVAETWKATEEGGGVCVGKPLPGAEIRIIGITDDIITEWKDATPVREGEKGEIVVKSRVASPSYFGLDRHTALAKIKDGNSFWHRMGDIGYFDPEGRLWFCGRKGHRVVTANGTLYPECTEAAFNLHPAVCRSALVGIGDLESGTQRPVVIIELRSNYVGETGESLTAELLKLGAASKHSSMIRDVLYYSGEFPTDIRHNAKIFREKLKTWAEKETAR